MGRIIDPWMQHAIDNIKADYGVDVRMEYKNKDLLKFGRNRTVGTVAETIMELPSGTNNETYLATNSITSIISTSAADGEIVQIEGHTISGSDFTFVTQSATLTGQTAVTLGTALARCTRIYNNDSTELAGVISATEADTYTAGVPDTDAGVHCQIRAGQQQSDKAATTLSSVDYWVLTSYHGEVLTKASAFAEVLLEIRLSGKIFRAVSTLACSNSNTGLVEFKPYFVVPPNSDIRLRAISDTDAGSGRDVSGEIHGVLLKAGT